MALAIHDNLTINTCELAGGHTKHNPTSESLPRSQFTFGDSRYRRRGLLGFRASDSLQDHCRFKETRGLRDTYSIPNRSRSKRLRIYLRDEAS